MIRLRPIRHSDVNDSYVSWFNNQSAEFIEFGAERVTLKRLKSYVDEKISDPHVLMLAIVDRSEGRHIGNLKFEPFSPREADCDLGVFIGDTNFLGRGYGSDAIRTALDFLRDMTAVESVSLGVDQRNSRAIAAYSKLGFSQVGIPRRVLGGGGEYVEIRMRVSLEQRRQALTVDLPDFD